MGLTLAPQSGYDHKTLTQGLHAIVAQLTANIKTLSDVKNNLEMELASMQEATESITACLDAVKHTLDELQEKAAADFHKQTSSKTSSNGHIIVKVCISTLSDSVLIQVLIVGPNCQDRFSSMILLGGPVAGD